MSSVHRGAVIDSIQRLFDRGTLVALGERQLLERFLSRGDESAFEAIVGRHGPMVLSVCRHVLDDQHDVEDAFQATFLIVVKKASSIRDRDVLGTWLYGVARRVAVRARTNSRHRQSHERIGVESVDVQDNRNDQVESNEIRAIVDAELERLPFRYRAALVLCDLEGQTHEQAAVQLRCPVGTVKSRLSRGRERLRLRLARRGLAAPLLLPCPTLADDPAQIVSSKLQGQTIKAATQLATKGAVTTASITAGTALLMEGIIHNMAMTKLRIAIVVSLAAGFVALGAWSAIGLTTARQAEAAVQGATDRTRPAAKRVAEDVQTPTPVEPGSERFRLANGLTAMLRPIRGTKSIALIVLYSMGSDHDPEGRSGLTHMIEHLYVTSAAGLEKARTAEQFAGRYALGANAQTGYRYTVVATIFPSNQLDAELKDAAARMGSLQVTPADLDRERPRIIQEVGNMFGKIPSLGALNNARELVRPTPGGGRDGGKIEHIRTLTTEELRAYSNRYYKPCNAILSLAGDINSAGAGKAIRANFGNLPPGEKVPTPQDPGKPKFGTTSELTIKPFDPDAASTACLAYAAPQPGSDLYVPFLVLVTRLWDAGTKLGDGGPTGSPVYFTPLDDGTIVGVSTEAKPGESSAQAFARIEGVVADAIKPKLHPSEHAAARQQLALLLTTHLLPDNILANNPYEVAFGLGRRHQLGIDPVKFNRSLDAVTEQEIRRAAAEVFAPSRHAGAFISVKK